MRSMAYATPSVAGDEPLSSSARLHCSSNGSAAASAVRGAAVCDASAGAVAAACSDVASAVDAADAAGIAGGAVSTSIDAAAAGV